jgi:hypothetical protein
MGAIVALPPKPPPAIGAAAIGSYMKSKKALKSIPCHPEASLRGRDRQNGKRCEGKTKHQDSTLNVKFKVEELGNKACCCRIGR